MTQVQQPVALERLRDRLNFTHARHGKAERFVEVDAPTVLSVIGLAEQLQARIAELEAAPAAQAVELPEHAAVVTFEWRKKPDVHWLIDTVVRGTKLYTEQQMRAALAAPAPAAVAVPGADYAARFKAQHDFLNWNRAQQHPPVKIAQEYGVFNNALYLYQAALAATPAARAQSFVREPDAWAAVHFGGKRAGKIYNTCETEQQCKDYIEQVHRSSDSITLADPQPVYVGTAPQAQDVQRHTFSDEQIEEEFVNAGGRWSGDHWLMEDADLHPYVRGVEARSKESEMANEYRSWIAFFHRGDGDYEDFLRAAIAASAAQGKQ